MEDERSLEGIVVPRLFVPEGHNKAQSSGSNTRNGSSNSDSNGTTMKQAPADANSQGKEGSSTTAPAATSSTATAAPSASAALASSPAGSPSTAVAAAVAPPPMCDHCSSHVATIRCVECAANLCAPGCDDEMHAIKGMQEHTRTPLAPTIPAAASSGTASTVAPAAAPSKAAALPALQEFCDHCNSHVATLYCDECVMILCQPGCDEEVHATKAKGAHARVSYPIRDGQQTSVGAESKHNSSHTAHPSAAAQAASVAHAATVVAPSASARSKRADAASLPICASCESHIAEVSCVACGGGAAASAQHLCRTCDEEAHVSKAKSNHRRTAYSAATPNTDASSAASTEFCGYCSSHVATLHCAQCSMILCSPGCDDEVHWTKDKNTHVRVPYPAVRNGSGASESATSRISERSSKSNSGAVALAASNVAASTVSAANARPASAAATSAASSRPRTAGGASVAGADEFAIDDSLLAETPPPTADPAAVASSAALPSFSNSRPKSRAGSAAGNRTATGAANSSTLPATSPSGDLASNTAGKSRSTSGSSSGALSKRQASTSSNKGGGSKAAGSCGSSVGIASPQVRTRPANSSSGGESAGLPDRAGSNITPPATATAGKREPSLGGSTASASSSQNSSQPPSQLSPQVAATLLTTAEIMPLDSVGGGSGRSKAGGAAEKVNYNYVLYSLRNKCTKLEENVEELQSKLARSEAEAKAYADAFTKEQRVHKEMIAQRDLERAEKEAAQQTIARLTLERDEWRARFETRQPEIDELTRSHRAAQSKLAEQLAAMEKQVVFHSTLSSDKTAEIDALREDLSKASTTLSERDASIKREREINDKYKTYSAQYESLILTLREKLGEAERKLIGSTKWKAKAASYVEEWEVERKKMKRKIARQAEMVDALRQDLKDYRAILKYVSVRGFVNQFLLRKALRRLFTQALELATSNLIEQVEAQPKIHNSVQLDSKEDLSTRNQRIMNEYPWGNAGGAALLAAQNANAAAAAKRPGIDGPTSPQSAGKVGAAGAAAGSRRRPMHQFPPLTACVKSVVDQLHILSESSVLIRAQKRKWQETADSFFKRNIELTNSYLMADAELLTAKKKAAALKSHTRALQSRFAELESALAQASAERQRSQSELESLTRQGLREKAMVSHVAHAQFERSVELTRRVQVLESECRGLEQQKERLAKEVSAAQSQVGFMQYKAGESSEKQEQQLKLAAQTQALLIGWGARTGTGPGSGSGSRGSSPSRGASQPAGMHRALVPTTPAPATAAQSADLFSEATDEEKQSTATGGDNSGNGSDLAPSVTSTPYPPSAIVRSAGRPVSSPSDIFGSLSPYDYKLGGVLPGQVAPMSAARVAAMDPYRGDSYSRGPTHATMPYAPSSSTATPASRSAKAHHSPAARSAQMYRPILAAYAMPAPAPVPAPVAGSPAGSSTSRPSSSPSRRPGSSGSATARSVSNGGGGGVMSVPSKKRAAVGAGAAEALNRTILDAAMLRASRRSRSSGGGGGSVGSGSSYKPPAGSRAAQVQARQQEPAATAAPPPSPPPLASLKALMQAQQSSQPSHAQSNSHDAPYDSD